jgi:signal peptidase II
LLVLDFLAKRFVLAHQEAFRAGIPLIDGILRFTYVRNAGAAFGILQGGRWPFVVVSFAAILALIFVLSKGSRSRMRGTSYALILGGAAGNLIDRLFYGGRVVDFIEMSWRGHVFPVYNFADMGVSIGAAILILALLLDREEEAVPRQEEGPVAHEE